MCLRCLQLFACVSHQLRFLSQLLHTLLTFVWLLSQTLVILVLRNNNLPPSHMITAVTVHPDLAACLVRINRVGSSKLDRALSCTSASSLQCPHQELHRKRAATRCMHAYPPHLPLPPAVPLLHLGVCEDTAALLIATTLHSSHVLPRAAFVDPPHLAWSGTPWCTSLCHSLLMLFAGPVISCLRPTSTAAEWCLVSCSICVDKHSH